MNTIIDFSVKNKFLVIIITLILFCAGLLAIKHSTIDAIPDLSDTQVIIYTEWDRSPSIIENQVTYPIVNALLGAPRVKDVRGFSDFGYSYVYVIFDDKTDPYWARSRVNEYLRKIEGDLPEGVKTRLGPDATGVGWVFQYALVDRSGKHSLAELRTMQDWFLRFVLAPTEGVAEVAAIGGFQKQYQIKINPRALEAYRIPLSQIVDAVKAANSEVGARVLDVAGTEYMIRAQGLLRNQHDIENIVVATDDKGTPIYLRNIARVNLGPEMRRGVGDYNGEGDTVSGIVVIRYGQDVTKVIDRVKEKLKNVQASLPAEVSIEIVYDRSDLIKRAIHTLVKELSLEMIIVALVILLFLLHLPSAMIPIITLPVAVVLSFIPMYLLNISSNIMSLGGIAIAIGAMVDAAIIVVENTHKHLEEWAQNAQLKASKTRQEVIVEAIKEVAPASFYSLLVIAVSFLPVFALEAQEGKLFIPLALTKNLSMIIAAILSVTLDPALRLLLSGLDQKESFLMGKIRAEDQHPISRWLFKKYGPIVDFVVDHRRRVLAGAVMLLLLTIPLYFRLGKEFMPPLNEGSILYMPTTMPGISIGAAQELLQKQDQILKSFPEVVSVYGKAGRANTATDPAPLSMMETVIELRPQKEWRNQMSYEELIAEMNKALQISGTTNAWTMPIRNRIDMLSTGIRTALGIKIQGHNSEEIEQVGLAIEGALSSASAIAELKGLRSVFAERAAGGFYLDYHFNREKLARYGISIADAEETLLRAVGGAPVTTTIEGRERYSVSIRYASDYRSDLDSLKRILLSASPTMGGALIPIGDVAELKVSSGPSMIRNENGLLTSYVYIDVDTQKTDLGTMIKKCRKFIDQHVQGAGLVPQGVNLLWSGQYEAMARVGERLQFIIPLTLILIIFLLYFNTRSIEKTAIILLAVPFSSIGAIILLNLLGYNLSIAVWVGLIALLGVDAETGIFMLLYLDLAYERARREGRMENFSDLKWSIHQGAVKRIRPKVMTVGTLLVALCPIMLTSSMEAGADVMKRIAAPMLGGIVSSFVMELALYPAIFALWKERLLKKGSE